MIKDKSFKLVQAQDKLGNRRSSFPTINLGYENDEDEIKPDKDYDRYIIDSLAPHDDEEEVWAQFHQHSIYSFYARRSQKQKNSVK
jgi:hypothetical protein